MLSDQKLFKSLFMIQVLSAWLVFIGHYTAAVDSFTNSTAWDIAWNHLSRFGTVLLAMITGFFTAHSLYGGKPVTIRSFFSGKLLYIYLPFILSGFVYHYILIGGFPSRLQHFGMIFFGKTGMHLYFVFMICQYYVLAYIFRNLFRKIHVLVWLGMFFIIQYAFIAHYETIMIRSIPVGVRHWLPTWIFTIFLGHALYLYRSQIISLLHRSRIFLFSVMTVAVTSCLYFATSANLYTANHLRFVFAAAILLLALIYMSGFARDRFTLKFRKGLTFYIYLSHSIFIIYYNKYFIRDLEQTWLMDNKWASAAYSTVIFFTAFLFSYIIAIAVERLSHTYRRKKDPDRQLPSTQQSL